MSQLKRPLTLQTTFGFYEVNELIGQKGGAGKVFGGVSDEGLPVAVKVLSEQASRDKRRRFKNEIAFFAKKKHPNIVTVIDHGFAKSDTVAGPFYVMSRYGSNLRELMRSGMEPGQALKLFSQILDGVEAAHLQGVIHRDLKPENVLYDPATGIVAIADFGIAHFTEDLLITTVKTGPADRFANFQYAAPEQRRAGAQITETADIFALGLILNELFTSVVPHGSEYARISAFSAEHAYLDNVVASMIRQESKARPASVSEVKSLIMKYQAEAVSLQRLKQIQWSGY